MIAAGFNNSCVELLLSKRAQLEHANDQGETALVQAANMLVNVHGSMSRERSWTQYFFGPRVSFSQEQCSAVKKLIEAGADTGLLADHIDHLKTLKCLEQHPRIV
jgi:hypothetical protein